MDSLFRQQDQLHHQSHLNLLQAWESALVIINYYVGVSSAQLRHFCNLKKKQCKTIHALVVLLQLRKREFCCIEYRVQ